MAAEKDGTKEKSQDKGILRTDTALASPDAPRKRHPGPLDLSSTCNQPISQPLPSALATARTIEDLGTVSYLEGIGNPRVELDINAKRDKFRYDRDFLMQFMKICKDKPDNLPPLDAIGLEPSEQGAAMHQMSRGGSQRRSSAAMGPPSQGPARQGLGLGLSGFNGPAGNFTMGRFATSSKTSEERFKESQMGRSASMAGGPPGVGMAQLCGGRPSPMVHSSSQGGPSAMGNKRTRSKRERMRSKRECTRSKRGVDRREAGKTGSSLSQPGTLPLEPVAPLELSANRWQPQGLGNKKHQQPDTYYPEVVNREVCALLNKLTMERFDFISDQIIIWANKSENDHDGRTLIQVIRLVFEKATDEAEAAWSEMYARLCRKMMEQISPKVQDEYIKNAEGKPIAGGQLFRKYLLNRCQEEFERRWAAKENTASPEKYESDEAALYPDEDCTAQKARRQGLGLIKFIGELFKVQMLTERIMHECVKRLLGNVDNPEEEEIASLCKLLTTIGQSLDTPKARAHVDVYFSHMKELVKNPNVNFRTQFMLLDLLELRERKWISRHAAAGPTTISAIHAQAAKGYQRTLSMSRGSSKHGSDCGEHQVGLEGWAVAGNAPSRVPLKAGNLTTFGKISKMNSMTFGPSGVFAKDKGKRESASLSCGSNMFSKLMENPELAAEASSAAPSMSEGEAKNRVKGDSKEFFSIRDLDEAEVYFTELPSEHRWLLVDKLVSSAIESKEADAQLVGDFFSRAVSKNLCSPDHLEKGFMPTAEILDDIAIDAPKAFGLMAIMVKGAQLDEERRTRLGGEDYQRTVGTSRGASNDDEDQGGLCGWRLAGNSPQHALLQAGDLPHLGKNNNTGSTKSGSDGARTNDKCEHEPVSWSQYLSTTLSEFKAPQVAAKATTSTLSDTSGVRLCYADTPETSGKLAQSFPGSLRVATRLDDLTIAQTDDRVSIERAIRDQISSRQSKLDAIGYQSKAEKTERAQSPEQVKQSVAKIQESLREALKAVGMDGRVHDDLDSEFEKKSEDCAGRPCEGEACVHESQSNKRAQGRTSMRNASGPSMLPVPQSICQETQSVPVLDASAREASQPECNHLELTGLCHDAGLSSASTLSGIPDSGEQDGRPSVIAEQVRIDLKAAVEMFLTVRDVEVGKKVLKECPLAHRWRLVHKLVLYAAMRGVEDARLVGGLFSHATATGICSGETYESGFSPAIDELDVLSLHIPVASTLIAMMLKGAQLDSVRLERLASRSVGDDKELLLGLLL